MTMLGQLCQTLIMYYTPYIPFYASFIYLSERQDALESKEKDEEVQ